MLRTGIYRSILITILIAGMGFIPGVWLGRRYGHVLPDVLSRSSKCSLLDLPGTAYSGIQRDRLHKAARTRSKLERSDPQGFEYWATPQGPWWIPKGNSGGLFLVLSEQQSDIYSSALCRVRAGDIVLDCGAHIGSFTRNALSKGARLVIAIEPAPENLECLRRNFADEIAAGRVVVYPKGVWDRDAVLTLSSAGSAQHEVLSGDGAANQCLVKVPLTTIDALVGELQLTQVDFIKMDIEGAEERALIGAKNTLGKHKPRLAIAGYHEAEDYKAIQRVVSEGSTGYRMTCGPCYSARGTRPETLFFHHE